MQKKTGQTVDLKQVLTEIIEKIRNLSDCQSVAIRLHNNGDYPYFVYKGFPDFFVTKENSLWVTDDEGNIVLDEENKPSLECMCGNVINGRINPKRSYFTEKGSFWTNNTTQLIKFLTKKDITNRIRNMCHHSGYESVALIPLRANGRTLGLIQINDPRENMFTLEDIQNYESIANRVGPVILSTLEIQERMDDIFEFVNKLKG